MFCVIRSVCLTDFDGQLMGLILHKGSSTNSCHYIFRLRLVAYGLSVTMLKSIKLSLTISITLILFICYFTKEAHDGNILRALGLSQWMPPVPHEELLPCVVYFHLLLLRF